MRNEGGGERRAKPSNTKADAKVKYGVPLPRLVFNLTSAYPQATMTAIAADAPGPAHNLPRDLYDQDKPSDTMRVRNRSDDKAFPTPKHPAWLHLKAPMPGQTGSHG